MPKVLRVVTMHSSFKVWVSISLLIIVVALAITAYSLGYLTPSIVVNVVVGKKPVNAYVQVFAVLPPGHNESLIEVWSGTASNGGVVRVPITVLSKIASEWVAKGYGSEGGVGIEVVATYVNGSTVYYDMMFTAYEPGTLLSTISNPMLSMVRLNYMTVSLNLTNTYQLAKVLTKPQVPTPPAPPGCWWVNITSKSWQTPIIKIPIAWVYDNVPNYLGGTLGAYSQQSTSATVYFYASVGGLVQGGSTSVTYKFIGYSTYTSSSNWNQLAFGKIQPTAPPSAGFLYQNGTIGVATLQLYCITGPTNQYAYETFVASILGSIGTSSNITYLNGFLSQYKAYTGYSPQYVPFDEIYIGGGKTYDYWFSNVQAYSPPFGFSGTIPVGLIIAYIAQTLGKSLSIPGFILANLAAGIQITTTNTNIIEISIAYTSSSYGSGDLFVAALPVNYSSSSGNYFYYPFILGFNVTGLGSYSSSTSIYVDGPGVIFNPCIPINSYNWTVYVSIGNSPLLVPGGTVTATVYNSQGSVVWSGTFTIPTSIDAYHPTNLPSLVYPGPYSTTVYPTIRITLSSIIMAIPHHKAR